MLSVILVWTNQKVTSLDIEVVSMLSVILVWTSQKVTSLDIESCIHVISHCPMSCLEFQLHLLVSLKINLINFAWHRHSGDNKCNYLSVKKRVRYLYVGWLNYDNLYVWCFYDDLIINTAVWNYFISCSFYIQNIIFVLK